MTAGTNAERAKKLVQETCRLVPSPSELVEALAAAGLLAADPPPPAEPPIGTMLRGTARTTWVRVSSGNWFKTGNVGTYTWEDALISGADPNRPLAEIPDPDDQGALRKFADRVGCDYGCTELLLRELRKQVAE